MLAKRFTGKRRSWGGAPLMAPGGVVVPIGKWVGVCSILDVVVPCLEMIYGFRNKRHAMTNAEARGLDRRC